MRKPGYSKAARHLASSSGKPEKPDKRDAIASAGALLRQGKILLIKGLGGFHLACDASNAATVQMLRERKRRYQKPFAMMARDLATIKKYCIVSDAEAGLLESSEAPIVLLREKCSIF